MKFTLYLIYFTLIPAKVFSAVEVGSEYSIFHQPSTRFANQGYATLLTSKQTLRSGLFLEEKAGYEHFIGDAGGNHHGLRAEIIGAYGVNSTSEIMAGGGYRTLGKGWGDFELFTTFNSKEEDFEWDTGFSRKFLLDSYLSYAGKTGENGNSIGRSRIHDFHAAMTWNEGVLRYRLRPSLGWISIAAGPSNFRGSLRGTAELLMIEEDIFDLDLIYEAVGQHYQFDQSGSTYSVAEPYPGGYFSPRLFIEQTPHIAMRFRPKETMEFAFLIGPSFQIIREFQKGSRFGVGAVSSFGFDYRMNKVASLHAGISYSSLASEWEKFQSLLNLNYRL